MISAPLLADSGQDSLDTVELVMALKEIDNDDTVDDTRKEDLAQGLGTFREMVHRMTRHAPRSR